jgi:redox-sensitive bicupin YhaK (pirin superfamily)
MIELRSFASLGGANHGWLDAKHHFSFASYYDPNRLNWGPIRVWNDDTIQAGTGFSAHPHRDMEIITYVRDGAITHKDNLGNEGRTKAGDVQVMSAGTGITHSEYNREMVVTRIFQIWILPNREGEPPAWGAKPFPKADRAGAFVTLASGIDGDESALPIRADARVSGATIKAGETVRYPLGTDRYAYLVPARGKVRVGDVTASERDGVAIRNESEIVVTALDDSEVVLVDAA